MDKNCHLTDPCREGSTIAVGERSDPVQRPPPAALPDVSLDVGVELPEAAATAHIPRVDRPPVVLDIPSSPPEQSEPRRSRKHPLNGSGPHPEATRDRGPALLLLQAILESVHPQPVDGVSNGSRL